MAESAQQYKSNQIQWSKLHAATACTCHSEQLRNFVKIPVTAGLQQAEAQVSTAGIQPIRTKAATDTAMRREAATG